MGIFESFWSHFSLIVGNFGVILEPFETYFGVLLEELGTRASKGTWKADFHRFWVDFGAHFGSLRQPWGPRLATCVPLWANRVVFFGCLFLDHFLVLFYVRFWGVWGSKNMVLE